MLCETGTRILVERVITDRTGFFACFNEVLSFCTRILAAMSYIVYHSIYKIESACEHLLLRLVEARKPFVLQGTKTRVDVLIQIEKHPGPGMHNERAAC